MGEFQNHNIKKTLQGFLGCTPAMSHGDRNKHQNRTHCLLAVCWKMLPWSVLPCYADGLVWVLSIWNVTCKEEMLVALIRFNQIISLKVCFFIIMNEHVDMRCDRSRISCVSACAGSPLCSHHVFEFHLQISTVSNCNMKW